MGCLFLKRLRKYVVIVPTLNVGTFLRTLCVHLCRKRNKNKKISCLSFHCDAKRQRRRYHAKRGNENYNAFAVSGQHRQVYFFTFIQCPYFLSSIMIWFKIQSFNKSRTSMSSFVLPLSILSFNSITLSIIILCFLQWAS